MSKQNSSSWTWVSSDFVAYTIFSQTTGMQTLKTDSGNTSVSRCIVGVTEA